MQWDRNSTSRLERLSNPVEQGCEVSLHNNQMVTPPEEHQSQQGIHREPNAYRSMRDHITPTKGECTLMHYTPCRGCGSEALSGAPAPNFSWYGK